MGKGQLDSNRVQNPHDPDATYAVKGQGQPKKEHVGYKVQVAEPVCEAVLEPGEPTRNFLTGIVTQLAYESDEAGARLMDQEQGAMGLEKPPVQYVDGRRRPRGRSPTGLSSARIVRAVPSGGTVWGRSSGTARSWWGSITRCCRGGVGSSRASRSSIG